MICNKNYPKGSPKIDGSTMSTLLCDNKLVIEGEDGKQLYFIMQYVLI